MSEVSRILNNEEKCYTTSKFPIEWSQKYKEKLGDMASKRGPTLSVLDDRLAASMLLCAEGKFDDAEAEITELMRTSLDIIIANNENFISVLFAVFVAQRFDLVAAMLIDKYGFKHGLSITVEDDGPGPGRIRWDVSEEHTHRFVFDSASYRSDNTRLDVLVFQWQMPLYANFSDSDQVTPGSLIINQGDIGQTPGLAWCDNRPSYFLVPDCVFVPTKGYQNVRDIYRRNLTRWEDRKPVALWRGSTTGIPQTPNDWRSLDRIALCEISRQHEHLGLLDVGISSVTQFQDPVIFEEIKNSGLMKAFTPWEEWGKFKYHIDIDGNTNAWTALFQKLLTGSPVLKVESPRGLNQWYYDKLKPWENYIPIAPDLSDLIEKISWLTENDRYAREVGTSGRKLAERLTYTRELERSITTIAAGFGHPYFDSAACGPFGRVRTHSGDLAY